MKPWFGSIRVRLAATITGALALVLTLVAISTVVLVRDTLYRRIDTELTLRSQRMIALVERSQDVQGAAKKFVEHLSDPDHPANIQILSRDNAPVYIAVADPSRRLPVSIQPTFVTLEKEQLRCYSLATPLLQISIALPIADIEASISVLRWNLAIAVPLALVLVLVLGYSIARRSLAPVDKISQTAHRITSTSLKQRIPQSGTNDEIGRLITTLNEMIERLDGSFRAITTFTTNAAHELRTPLTILRGELELALRNTSLDSDQRSLLESNFEEVIRLNGIVEDLFMLARADSNALALSYEIVSLGPWLEHLQGKMTSLASTKNMTVRLDLHDSCTIVGDGNRLTQVVLNIVDNAVKYSPENTTIHIDLSAHATNAVMRIADEGPGIIAEHREKIFERFYRGDDARNRAEGGTGLGLAIAQSIVAAHNGTITVHSEPGSGSVFEIVLPLAEID